MIALVSWRIPKRKSIIGLRDGKIISEASWRHISDTCEDPEVAMSWTTGCLTERLGKDTHRVRLGSDTDQVKMRGTQCRLEGLRITG